MRAGGNIWRCGDRTPYVRAKAGELYAGNHIESRTRRRRFGRGDHGRQELHDRIRPRRRQAGKPAAKGTGVLASYKGVHGIITAAHVDREIRKLDGPVGIVKLNRA
jgi:hypothetical protein